MGALCGPTPEARRRAGGGPGRKQACTPPPSPRPVRLTGERKGFRPGPLTDRPGNAASAAMEERERSRKKGKRAGRQRRGRGGGARRGRKRTGWKKRRAVPSDTPRVFVSGARGVSGWDFPQFCFFPPRPGASPGFHIAMRIVLLVAADRCGTCEPKAVCEPHRPDAGTSKQGRIKGRKEEAAAIRSDFGACRQGVLVLSAITSPRLPHAAAEQGRAGPLPFPPGQRADPWADLGDFGRGPRCCLGGACGRRSPRPHTQ